MVAVPRIVDLTYPIEDHFRWPVERSVKGDLARGDPFQITRLGWAVHGFTHMDSPRHILADGRTTSEVPLEATIGPTAIIDLADVRPDEPIDSRRLAARAAHLAPGDIALLRTGWDSQRALGDPAFWREAPFLTRDAACWLLDRGPKACAFDFPQDYPIRLTLDGEVRPMAEQVTHDVLLRQGVILIEYLCNTLALEGERTWLCCLPLKVPGADGAPARVVAFQSEAPA